MATINFSGKEIEVRKVHTLILGSGAAGLNAAVQLHAKGVEDILIVTEGLQMGTSINTGSDKQTYYKLGLYGSEVDSPKDLAQSFFDGGSMHGDLALAEASISARAFLNLVNLGVKFPQDAFGQFVGYKTDHDPRQRATSFGPYTSKEMCRCLIEEIKRRNIECAQKRVAIQLLIDNEEQRSVGIVAIDCNKKVDDCLEIYMAENIVFATGGPGGIYKTSVYPKVHTGAIGLALLAGAKAQSLPESQYGTASTKFRWNVSGTYMQVLPRMISTAADGESDEKEFLTEYFDNSGKLNSAVFLKGYQWPFDPRKVVGGSSIVDIAVYLETAIKGRRVYMDFRRNSSDFSFDNLDSEAYDYLKNSDALFGLPIDRLQKMNPVAISLYSDHGIDITKEPLEIAVCAQHNNGGLAANVWWESTNIQHLFPIGEVNGSHGVYRPGGSALNSGQVAGFRVADYIEACYKTFTIDEAKFVKIAQQNMDCLGKLMENSRESQLDVKAMREEFQMRMTKYGSHIRSAKLLEEALVEANKQFEAMWQTPSKFTTAFELADSMRNIQLCFAHKVYLDAIKYQIDCGVGSRGSALVMDENGQKVHEILGEEWYFAKEDSSYQNRVLESIALPDGTISHEWVERRNIPETNAWFENAWAAYRENKIFNHG